MRTRALRYFCDFFFFYCLYCATDKSIKMHRNSPFIFLSFSFIRWFIRKSMKSNIDTFIAFDSRFMFVLLFSLYCTYQHQATDNVTLQFVKSLTNAKSNINLSITLLDIVWLYFFSLFFSSRYSLAFRFCFIQFQ